MRRNMYWGLILITAGIIALLIELEVVASELVTWWPVLLVALGLWFLLGSFRFPSAQGATVGLVLASAGAVLLAENQGWIREGFFFPVMLVALGVGVLLRPVLGAQSRAG